MRSHSSSNIRNSSNRQGGSSAMQIRFNLTIEQVSMSAIRLPEASELFVVWQQGSEKRMTSKAGVLNESSGIAEIYETLSIDVPMAYSYGDSHFQKNLSTVKLMIKTDSANKAGGVAEIDLSEYLPAIQLLLLEESTVAEKLSKEHSMSQILALKKCPDPSAFIRVLLSWQRISATEHSLGGRNKNENAFTFAENMANSRLKSKDGENAKINDSNLAQSVFFGEYLSDEMTEERKRIQSLLRASKQLTSPTMQNTGDSLRQTIGSPQGLGNGVSKVLSATSSDFVNVPESKKGHLEYENDKLKSEILRVKFDGQWSLESEQQALKDRLESLQLELEKVSSANAIQTSERQALANKNASLVEQLRIANKEITEQATHLARVKQASIESNERLVGIQKELLLAQMQYERTKKFNETLVAELNSLKTHSLGKLDHLAETAGQLQNVAMENNELRIQLARLNAEMESERGERALTATRDSMTAEFMQRQIDTLIESNSSLQRHFDNQKVLHFQEVRSAEMFRESSREKDKEIARLQSEKLSMFETLNAWKAKVDALEKSLVDVRKQLESEQLSLSRSRLGGESNASEKDKMIRSLVEQIEKLHANYFELEKSFETRAKQLEDRLHTTTDARDHFAKENARLSLEAKTSKEAIEAAEKRVAGATKKLAEKEKENAKLKKTNNRLHSQVAEVSEKMVSDLTSIAMKQERFTQEYQTFKAAASTRKAVV